VTISSPPNPEWSLPAWIAHQEELRAADLRFQDERDRRYTERDILRQEALQIKAEADKRALELQTETQKYKDEKANELRSQIERERGTYVTHAELTSSVEKIEATLSPLIDFRSGSQGIQGEATRSAARNLSLLIIVVGAFAAVIAAISPHIH
jgi:hypothetical protein